ncbi:MAG: hypothetical protein ACRD30_08830 [Bryobacteraceae bacterium]
MGPLRGVLDGNHEALAKHLEHSLDLFRLGIVMVVQHPAYYGSLTFSLSASWQLLIPRSRIAE